MGRSLKAFSCGCPCIRSGGHHLHPQSLHSWRAFAWGQNRASSPKFTEVFDDQTCCAMCAAYKSPLSGPQITNGIQSDIKSTEYENVKKASWKCPLCN
ncbi:hypothetical protein CHARACLAT_031230 [Characodon lateralis]|uniref:Uncharacterized protein n=1 Tax=Characodon lateralis TaxID=208331 RepID=A0ABU7D6C4_9TELE|nr:hypothetical protein [Characodon lateralis]